MNNVDTDKAKKDLSEQITLLIQCLSRVQLDISVMLRSLISSDSQSSTPAQPVPVTQSVPATPTIQDPLSNIVNELDKGRNIWFYSVSLAVLVIALYLVLSFLFELSLPKDSLTTMENALKTLSELSVRDSVSRSNVIDSVQKSQNLTQREQIVDALKTLDHANSTQAIIVGAKILTALTLGIVLIVALSRIITTRYRTIATLYGMAQKK